MYLLTVLLLMLIFPMGSVFVEALHSPGAPSLISLIGKWFVFWGAGVRLLLAGLRQFFRPNFTAEQVFDIKSHEVLPIVRELGVANFSAGVVGVLSLAEPSFILPAAIASMIFYGVAGLRHMAGGHRSRIADIAMISDLFGFVIFATYVGYTCFG